MANNKVRFNLKNIHYAILTEGTDSLGNTTYSYGTPVHVPGAVTLTADASGDSSTFYADGIAYYVSQANSGYEGDLEMAKITDQMQKDVFGMTQDDTSKVITENANVEPKNVALLFQIDGDQTNELYVLYKVSLGRPGIGSTTNTETKEPQTQSMSITVMPRDDGTIQSHTTADTPASVKNAWFSTVYDGALSADKNITSFRIGEAVGVISGNTIAVEVPSGTSVTALVPEITVSAGATILPASGVAQNFTSPVEYIVGAADGTTKTYTVTVTVEN